MKRLAKPIHVANASYLPTPFHVEYLGMPNGKIYIIFSRYHKTEKGHSGIEFVFAVHKEYIFDYEKEIVIKPGNSLHPQVIFPELVDKPDLQLEEIKIERNIRSYAEALKLLNQEAEDMDNIRQIIPNAG